MSRTINNLSAAEVSKKKEPGMYADGGGLYLQVAKRTSKTAADGDVTKSWIFRFMLAGKARYMGLGDVNTFSLKEARDRARAARQKVTDGIDPIEVRKETKASLRADDAKRITFKEASTRYIAAHKAGWKNEKHSEQWKNTLETYAGPIIGDLPIAKVDDGHISQILDPIWATKNETATRVRGRVESILDWARVKGFRPKNSDNPARWRGHLDKTYPAPSKVKKVEHQPALPYAELPAFMGNIRGLDFVSAKALAFCIMTVSRTQAVTGATWSEIDMVAKIWTIPGSRKGTKLNDEGRIHRVPLSDRAIEILKSLPREEGNPHLFIGGKKGSGLSTAAMAELLKNYDLPSDVPGRQPVVHGFRSTFRDWAAERSNFPREIAEAALAHVVKDKTEAAYQRGDLLEKRRRLMTAWAQYCAEKPAKSGNVVVAMMGGRA
ncbi:tyrosine-type recombinase/integrase [Mesorhizobium carmichaelinearum]|uniref:tyrosine-type recombinase/integrase n=1 Tax=Mesorhizobium carmichaelinearum TaxID=1208188 RepID=UPI000BA3C10B|nr:site-specific integrase [Mesorhizobium carmichaelinearum]